MKRITILLVTAFLFGVVGCQKQDLVNNANESANSIEKAGPGGIIIDPINPNICDEDYVFPAGFFDETMHFRHYIEYDSDMTPEEIHCKRYEFFINYPGLMMGWSQPSDEFKDIWIYPLEDERGNGALGAGVNADPDVSYYIP
jgi:hypothetical protein